MQAFNLRFAPANSFRQRRIYLKLYPLLAEQANGPSGAIAPAQTTQAAENAGASAIDGLKSAAVDFFKHMDWKHLTGTSKPGER
jgi:hypothetical protein